MHRPLALLVGIIFGLAAAAAAKEPPQDQQFLALHQLIKPRASEDKWTAIQWRADLWAARREAAEKGKPILLWEMDGHPLGCV